MSEKPTTPPPDDERFGLPIDKAEAQLPVDDAENPQFVDQRKPSSPSTESEAVPASGPALPEGAVLEAVLLRCGDCGRGGIRGVEGLEHHKEYWCVAHVGERKVGDVKLEPIPSNRPTMAWFFKPPLHREEVFQTAGLPRDCFYTTSAWTAAQVDYQTRKTFVMPDGRTENVRLVCPIDRHDQTWNGAPVVAMLEPGASVQGLQSWQDITRILEEFREDQMDRELEAIEDLREEISDGGMVGAQRTDMRQRLRVLEAHLAELRAGFDFASLYGFFVEEALRSQATLKTPQQRFGEQVNEAVAKHLAEIGERDQRVGVA